MTLMKRLLKIWKRIKQNKKLKLEKQARKRLQEKIFW